MDVTDEKSVTDGFQHMKNQIPAGKGTPVYNASLKSETMFSLFRWMNFESTSLFTAQVS